MANTSSNRHFAKGISPVVATILMVLITVVLVAFAYSWLQGMMSNTEQSTNDVISNQERMGQKVTIVSVYKEGSDLRFILKALTTNKYGVEMNGTSYLINGVPASAASWDGGISGVSCNTADLSLAPGSSCYGKIINTGCHVGDSLKISLSWGAESSKGIDRCG